MVPVSRGEVIDLKNVVVIGVGGLTVGHVDNEEFWSDFCHTLSLLKEGRHHFVYLRFANHKLLPIFGVAEDV